MAICHRNWFDGEVCSTEYFDPALPSDFLTKQITAVATTVGQATAKVNEHYASLSQDERCAAKSGVYSLNVSLQFMKLKKGNAVFCDVLWILCVSSDDIETIIEPAPSFTADWNGLNREWVQFLHSVDQGQSWKSIASGFTTSHGGKITLPQ